MSEKKVPFTIEQLEAITKEYPTPFHIYSEEGIVENMKRFLGAFSWNKGFKNYFAVKATPNPYIMRLLQPLGVGADCSSIAELILCEKVGITGHDIMFTSNDTPYVEYKKALDLGAIINLDDITHIDYLLENHGSLPETMCLRYNPGDLKSGGNDIIGVPTEAKYGMTREQALDAYKQMKTHGVKHFGLHVMLASNDRDVMAHKQTAEICFEFALEIREKVGIELDFIDLGGGIGVAYRPEEEPMNFEALGTEIKESYERILLGHDYPHIALSYECGRMVTGPFGWLVSTAIHKKEIYRNYIGLDSCMANLMRPALYGSYHHITVMGKEDAPIDHVYDVTGSLCENNDKFAIQRELPKIDIGDFVIIHDTGAHGHSMGFNYNGKLRSAELLLHKDGSVTQIRRAETYDDLFGTLDFSNL